MSEQMNTTPEAVTSDPAWQAMKDAEVQYLADPSQSKRDEFFDRRLDWLTSEQGIAHLRELGCQEAADHFADIATWRLWASHTMPELRKHAAQVSRDANIVARLSTDSDREVVSAALANMLRLTKR